MRYGVYQQRTPKKEGEEWIAHLVFVGTIDAITGEAAIDLAKSARMTKFPIVQKVTA